MITPIAYKFGIIVSNYTSDYDIISLGNTESKS